MQSPPLSLYAEAIATIIAVFLTAGLGYWIARLTRERPPRVIIQEISKFSLLEIHPNQRERLEIYYHAYAENMDKRVRRRINGLEQSVLVIYNNGSRDLEEPISISLKFEAAQTWIGYSVDESLQIA